VSELHAASSSPRRHLAVGAIADQGRRRRLGCGLRLLAGVLAAAPLSPAAAPDAASDAALAGRSAAAPSVITEPRGRAAPAATIVSTTGQLRKAVAAAHPGEVILIAPGVYQTIVRFAPGNSGAVEAPVVLGARDGLGTVVIDGDGANITVKLSGAAYVEIRDLEITGGGFHGVFLDRGAHHITIRHNRIYDNHRVRPLNSHAEIKGSGGEGRPFEVAIVDNEIFHRTHPPGGNFQGIDCNFCDRFRISRNYLHDVNSPTAQPYSHYDRGACIQIKSRSTGTIIARNRIARCHIGIVYGGEGLASPEHQGGIIESNLIHDSAEMAIAIVGVRDGKVYHNTLFNNGESIRIAPDRRHPPGLSEADVANNILDHPFTPPSGLTRDPHSNLVLTAVAHEPFVDVARRDFRLRPSAVAVIDRGADLGAAAARDYAGTPRPQGRARDIGAFEHRTEVSR
jgi:Right handed beta helix region/Chondroitinase B